MASVVRKEEVPDGASLAKSSDVDFAKVPKEYVVTCRDGVVVHNEGGWTLQAHGFHMLLGREVRAVAIQ